MIKIELSQGKFALIDDEDLELIGGFNKWYATGKGNNFYAQTKILREGKKITKRMHRVIMNCLDNEIVDHIDGNGLNNQKINLRKCTIRENNLNRRPQKNGSSLYKGVSLHSQKYKDKVYLYWKASLRLDGVSHTKIFKTELEAVKYYNELSIKHHGEFCFINTLKE